MSTRKYINGTRCINYFKSLPIEKYKEIQIAAEKDQNYALIRYRELVKARKEREKLRPREPEVYHRDIYNK